jgi:hypothetical protein
VVDAIASFSETQFTNFRKPKCERINANLCGCRFGTKLRRAASHDNRWHSTRTHENALAEYLKSLEATNEEKKYALEYFKDKIVSFTTTRVMLEQLRSAKKEVK